MTHRIGMIGVGIMGRRMADRIAAHPDFTLAAAWDPNAAALDVLRKDHPGFEPAGSAAALVARDDVDCVYIASPPASHARHAHAAFDCGKAVFCEKPLTVDDAEGAALVARAERESRRAAVNFSLASSPSFRKIERIVAAGEIGPITRVDLVVRFAKWPRGWQHEAASWLARSAEGGFVREVVSHFIFTTQRLLGPLRVKASRVDRPGPNAAEQAIMAEMESSAGAAVTLDGRVAGTADDHNLWTVTGTRGAVRIRDWHGLEQMSGATWRVVETSSIDDLRIVAGRAQLDQLGALLNGRPQTLPNLAEAFAVQRTIEALLRG